MLLRHCPPRAALRSGLKERADLPDFDPPTSAAADFLGFTFRPTAHSPIRTEREVTLEILPHTTLAKCHLEQIFSFRSYIKNVCF